MTVRQQSKRELVAAVQQRYARAGRAETRQILDEFVAATGYQRRADTLEELATRLELDPAAVRESVDRRNENCRRGEDRDYRRPPPDTAQPFVDPVDQLQRLLPTMERLGL